VLATKAVKQNYKPTLELEAILETFREMVNYCIFVGLEKGITSRFRLSNEVYRDLHNGLHTWYALSAIEKATVILKNYRKSMRKNPKTKRPYVHKPFLSIGNQAYKIVGGQLRLPTKPRQFVYIPLNKHTLDILSEPSLKLGSVTLTASTLSIAFSKETAETEPTGYMGLDSNLDNVTTASNNGEVQRFDLSEASRIKVAYRAVKSHFRRNDVRIRRKIYGKYGLKERNRVNQILHRVSKNIVEKAKVQNYGIVMEKLTGIRKLYRRGNGQGRDYRFRLSSWSFYELQRQIEYKAKWEGIKVIYVPPRKTSSTCAICGSEILECAGRKVYCPQCRALVDRDVNAARNILARGLRFGPVALPCEAMVPERGKPIRKVDGSELGKT
jgi:putative transposase